MTIATSAVLLLGVLSTSLTNEDGEFSWPQWDGPHRDNRSRETEWRSEGATEHLWETEVGLGYSTVSVVGGKLYTMGYDREAGLDMVFCFDAVTGEEVWVHTYPSKIWNQAHEGGTVNTPSVEGELVYTLNREGNLFALEAETGEVVWHVDLMGDDNLHELEIPTWGFSASPLLLDDGMYLNCGRLLAIDKENGEVLWRTEDYGHGYGTPLALEVDGEPALAVVNGRGVAVVARETGEELYYRDFAGRNLGVSAATPILIDDALFVSSGTVPAGALLAFAEGELVPVWENREMVNTLSGCVRVGDHLYGFDQGVLKCIDLEGETRWQERGIGNGAVTAAGERLLVMGATGELIVAEATPEELRVLSRTELFDAGKYWSKPILVNGIVYCRSSEGRLVARDHRPVEK